MIRTITASLLALAAVLLLPSLAQAQLLLDTGTPGGTPVGSPVIVSSSSSPGVEFFATAGQGISELSAYLANGSSSSGFFTFDIYSSLRTSGNRVSPVYSVSAAYTGAGWNSEAANFTFASSGDYYLTLQTASGTTFDAPLESATSGTGTAPAVAYISGSGTNLFYTTSTADPIGVQVTLAPEPSTWALMLTGLGLLGFAVRRRCA